MPRFANGFLRRAALVAASLLALAGIAANIREAHAANFPYDGSCSNASPLEQQTASWVMACVDAHISAKDHSTPIYVPKITVTGPANFLRIIRAQCDGVATRPKDIVDGKIVDHTGGGIDKDKAARCVADLMIDAKARELCGQNRIADDTQWGPAPLPFEAMEACKRGKVVDLLLQYEPNVSALCKNKQNGQDKEDCVDTVYQFGALDLRTRLGAGLDKARQERIDEERAKAIPARQLRKYGAGSPEADRQCRGGYYVQRGDSLVCEIAGGAADADDPGQPARNSSGSSSAPFAGGIASSPTRSQSGASRGPVSQPRVPQRSFRAAARGHQSTITAREFGDVPSVRGYDNKQMAVVTADGRKVNAQPLIVALQKVSPQAAQAPFTTNSNGSLALSPAAQRAIADNASTIRTVGGVALDVTFENLTRAGLSVPRPGAPSTVVENPILISLQRLVAAAKPYTASQARWAQLPEDIRYPGGIGRVRGFILDPDSKDVVIVGTAARSKETRLDIDVFITLMDVAWAKGLTPAVSLDRQPNAGGEVSIPPQVLERKGGRVVSAALSDYTFEPGIRQQVTAANYPRLVNLPSDALVSRILLDADFEMKRVANGAMASQSKDFKSGIELLAEQKRTGLHARFWFHPIPLRPDTVRVASSGNAVLFDAGVQLLTENLTAAGGGAGEADPLATQVADSFSRNYQDIETWQGLEKPGIFTLLKGVTDIQTMAKLLRDAAVDAPVLDDFRKLPYRRLDGVQAIPPAYRGITIIADNGFGGSIFLSGGIELRSRATRRSFAGSDDGAIVTLQNAAGHFTANAFRQTVPVTFTLASQSTGDNAGGELARLAGQRLFASGQIPAAIAKLNEATNLDPLDIDGWTMLSIAQASAGQTQAANASLDRARLIDADDDVVRLATVQIAFITKAPLNPANLDATTRNDASDIAVQRGFSKLNVSLSTGQPANVDDDVAEALKLRPGNDQAYFLRGLTRFARDDYAKALDDISQVIRLKPDRADAYDLRGAIYNVQKRYSDAFTDFDRAIQLKPDSARSYDGRGQALYFQQNYKAAIADFDKAISLRPDFVWAFFKRGLALTRLNDNDRAIASFSDAIKFDPTHSFALARRGELLAAKGDSDKALDDYNRAIKLDPKDADTFFARATLFRDKGDKDAALADYGTVLALDPKNDKARTARAALLIGRQQGPDAIRDLDEAIKASPNVSINFVLRGDAQMLAGNAERAAADYAQAIKLDPQTKMAHVQLGVAHLKLGKPDDAVQDFTRAIAVNARDTIALADRGKVYLDQGKVDQALADLNAAIAIDGNSVQALTNRGVIYERRGDLTRAMADFEAVVRLDPKRAGGYTNRGNAYQDKGEFDRAIADFTQSLALEPNAPDVLTNRGGAYAEKGQADLALADFGAALKLNSRFAQAYSRRGEIYRRQNKSDAALADFEQALAVDPKSPGGLYGRGIVLAERRQYDRAISDFTALIALKPTFGQAYHERGEAWQAKANISGSSQDYDRAIGDYSEDIRISPQSALISYFLRGEIFRYRKDYGRAMADYDAALKLKPNWPAALKTIQDMQTERSGGQAPSLPALPGAAPAPSSAPATAARPAPGGAPTGALPTTMAELNALVQNDPKNAEAYFRLGVLYNQSGDKTRAMTSYTQAIKLNPKLVPALGNRGKLYMAQNDDARAIDDFTAAIKADPSAALPVFNRGLVLLRGKKLDPAIADFTDAIRLQPNDAVVYWFRASAYVQKQDEARALTDLDNSIRLDATRAESLALRARLNLDRSRLDLAASDVAAALKLAPQNADNLSLQGQVKFRAKDQDGALADFSAALQRDPRNLSALVYRSRVYFAKKDQTAALTDLNAALKIDPRQPEALYFRGVMALLNKQYDPALADLEASASVNPKDPETFFYIGFAYMLKKDFDRAIAAYSKAIDLNPRYVEAYKLRADAYKNKGDTEHAAADVATAQRMATAR